MRVFKNTCNLGLFQRRPPPSSADGRLHTANALVRLTPASGPQPRIISGFGGCVGGFWGRFAAAVRPRSGRAAAAKPPLQPKLLLNVEKRAGARFSTCSWSCKRACAFDQPRSASASCPAGLIPLRWQVSYRDLARPCYSFMKTRRELFVRLRPGNSWRRHRLRSHALWGAWHHGRCVASWACEATGFWEFHFLGDL